MDKEDLKKQFKEYLWRHYVSEMWYGASTKSWETIVDGFFEYYQPERSKREDCLKEIANLSEEMGLYDRCGALNTQVTE